MKQEQLKPNLAIGQLQERLMELKTILKNLKTAPASKIQGRLCISQKGKYTEYYHVTSTDKPRGKYITKKQEATACQKLITPLTLTDEQYAAQWKTTPYKGLPFSPDATAFTTLRKERVRSKSEVLIANALTQNNIPYRYEYPLTLKKTQQKDTTTFYPDFLCLNLRTRQEFYWEHFGLIDSAEYAQNATSKLNLYAQNQILPGRNLIITMETAADPLTPAIIDQMIKEFLE